MKQITVNKNEKVVLEFNLSTIGVDLKTGQVLLMVDVTDDQIVCFRCSHKSGQSWSVSVDGSTLTEGQHNYTLNAVVEHYFLEVTKGKLKVVGNKSVTIESHSDDSVKEDATTPQATSTKLETKVDEQHREQDGDNNQKKGINTKLVEEIIVSKNVTKDSANSATPLKESSDNVNEHTFTFFQVEHPYTKLRDKGQADQKARAILKRLHENKLN